MVLDLRIWAVCSGGRRFGLVVVVVVVPGGLVAFVLVPSVASVVVKVVRCCGTV
jgi:hypothetical protein